MTARLFVHSPSEVPDAPIIATQTPEFEHYGERALLLARPGDVVCVAQAVDARYLRFLDSLELGPRRSDIVVVEGVLPGAGLSARLVRDPDSLQRVAGRLVGSEPLVVCPFFATPDAHALGRALGERLSRPVRVEGGSPRLALRLHDKVAARALAESLGIPVAPGEVVRTAPSNGGAAPDLSALRRAIERWSEPTGAVIVRGSSGSSGSSVFTSRSLAPRALIDAIGRRSDNSLYLVEPLFEASVSPNVEIMMEPRVPPARQVGVTDQVLGPDLVYTGSVHPSRAALASQMVEDSLAVASWMRRRGFTGQVGFDFVEHRTGGRLAHFLTEINPRVNGASYPLTLLGRLAQLARKRDAPAPEAFRTGYLRVRMKDFGELAQACDSLLYDPAQGEGVVFYATGLLSGGKVGAACLGRTTEAVEDLQARLALRVGADLAASAPVEVR
jgi:hypothetical protein